MLPGPRKLQTALLLLLLGPLAGREHRGDEGLEGDPCPPGLESGTVGLCAVTRAR